MKAIRFFAIYIGLILGIGWIIGATSLTKNVSAVTWFGGGSTGVSTASCADGADDCYNGRTWVHYTYLDDTPAETTVGTAYTFDYDGRNAFYNVTSPINGSRISAGCVAKGGFWHLEYRSTVIDNYEYHVAFGSAPIKVLYQGGVDYYGDVVAVAPGNYDATKVRPDAIASSMDEIKQLYRDWREDGDPAVDVFFSSSSESTWFCGGTGTPTPDEAEISLSGVSRAGLANNGQLGKLTPITGTLGVEPTTDNYLTIEARLNYGYEDATFTARFKHYLKYDETKPDWLENEIKPNYTVKKCVGAGCDSTTSSNVASGATNRGLTGSYQTINTNSHSLAITGTKGKYVRVCEWLEFPESLTYSSEETDGKKGKVVNTGTTKSTDRACVIIRNPAWAEDESEAGTREVSVIGETPRGADFSVEAGGAGAVYSETKGKYIMRSVEATARFKQAMTRTDSGFNEAAPGTVTDDRGETPRTIATSPSIGDWSVTTKYNGAARVGTDGNHAVIPEGATRGATGYSATVAKPDWTTGDSASRTWKTERWDEATTVGGATENGWTTMTFDKSSSWLGILAGDEKEFAQSVYNASTSWSLGYKDYFLREAYCANVYASGRCTATAVTGGERRYLETRRKASRLAEDTSSNATSGEWTGTIRRDYNFDITALTPSGGDETMAAGEKFSVNFTATIRKDSGWDSYDTDSVRGYGLSTPLNRRYITGTGDDEKLRLVTYVVKSRSTGGADEDTYRETLKNAASGYQPGGANYVTDYCQFFREKLGEYFGSCTVDGEDKQFEYTGVSGASGNNWVLTAVDADSGYNGSFRALDLEVPNLEPGYKYCVALGASKKSSTNGNAVISGSFCTNIVKKPTVHVWGGSVSATGSVKTSLTNADPDGGSEKRPYSSWTDLGVIAAGSVNKMASGRSSATGVLTSEFGNIPCNNGSDRDKWYSPLTIANVGCSSSNPQVGDSGVVSSRNVYEKLRAKYAGGATTVASGGAIGSMTVGAGEKKVYLCEGSCRITGNITASGEFTRLSEVPQVIIIADGGISIDESVTEVDAWLVAQGDINTCAGYTVGTLNANKCTERLKIQGPVVGGDVELLRTFGADNAADTSSIAEEAERIVLSGTSLLFAGREAEIGEPSTTFLKKMPARY